MQIPQTNVQKIKAGAHAAQALLIFVGGCLALAVLTMSGGTGGEIGYFFGLCFLSVPALVYLVCVPMWTRAWRFQNVYAYAAVDMLYAVFWFAAFIAVAVWRGRGTGDGGDGDDEEGDEDNDNEGNCAIGSERRCSVAGATIGFGVIICILFILTSVLSGRAVMEYKRTGVMPNGEQGGRPQRKTTKVESHGNEDGGVWSSNTNDLDHDSDDGVNDPRRAYGQVPTEDDHESLLNGPGRQPSDPFNDHHGYSGGDAHPGHHSNASLSVQPPQIYGNDAQAHPGADSNAYVAPSALSPSGDYGETTGGRISFPTGNYGADFR